MPHCDPWSAHRTKDCALANTKGEQAHCHLGPSFPGGREAGVRQSVRKQGVTVILAPKTTFSTKLWSGCQLLTTCFWDPGRFTSTRSVTARDQLPEETHSTPGTVPLWCIQETEQPGLGRCIRHTTHLGQCSCQVRGHLSMLNLGRAQNTQPIGLCAFAEYSRTWVAERPWKCTKHRVHVGQCTCKTPWSLSSVDLGSTSCPGLRQTQCGPSTVSIHHTWQQYLLAVSLLFQSTIEQVSLNKWPPSPSHVRVEIRHWRLANRGSQNKQSRGNCPQNDRWNRLKPCS